MRKISTVFVLTLLTLVASAQNKMRPLEQLINETESGWPLVQEWINKAKNKVQVLPSDANRAKDALYKTQVTTRSPMGTIIYSTGGLLVDHGWIRILGSGSPTLNRSLPDWNKGKSFQEFGQRPAFLLIADDVVGGFFAVNGGSLGSDAGNIYYLSPDRLEWEPLDFSYTDFLHFCFNGDLATFYKDLRWKNWKGDVEKLDGDTVFTFYPYLWTKEGQNIDKVSRKPVPIKEQYILNLDLIKKLLEKKNGSSPKK